MPVNTNCNSSSFEVLLLVPLLLFKFTGVIYYILYLTFIQRYEDIFMIKFKALTLVDRPQK